LNSLAPQGFRDLGHAFRLFAQSAKKINPEPRERFNLGERLMLALCDEITIRKTRGGPRLGDRPCCAQISGDY
jgi:hypothetical protein